jgi:hypothetical protein
MFFSFGPFDVKNGKREIRKMRKRQHPIISDASVERGDGSMEQSARVMSCGSSWYKQRGAYREE